MFDKVEIVVFGSNRRVAVNRSPAVRTLDVCDVAAIVFRQRDRFWQLYLEVASCTRGGGPTIDHNFTNCQTFVLHLFY